MTQLAGGIAGGCAVHLAAEPRGVSLQAITANQHSDTKVGSGGGLSIVQSGGPMMGGFTEGEVAVANRKVWTFFSEGDATVIIDVKQLFTGIFPRGFSPWSGYHLFKGWEVEIVQEFRLISVGRSVNQRRKAVLTVTHPRIFGVAISIQHCLFQ